MIKQVGEKWILYSKDGSKKLGEFDSKKEAEDREKEIIRIKNMKQFKQYETSKNEDGSYNIHGLEIFKLGRHRGFDYDEAWATNTAIPVFESEKESGHLNAVIIGHNNGQEEKAAEGFMDNMKLEGDVIKVDLTKVPEERFGDLQKRKYPYRSVEVDPVKHHITALALLGGTRPYHKLPMMEFAELPGEDKEIINRVNDDKYLIFEEEESGDLRSAIETDEKLQAVRNIWWKVMDWVDKILFDKDLNEGVKNKEIKKVLGDGAQLINEKVNEFKEDKNMTFSEEQKKAVLDEHNAKFKEEHGMTPEELAAENARFKEAQKTEQENGLKNRIAKFCENLKAEKGTRVAPVVIDAYIMPFMESLRQVQGQTMIKFKEGDEEKESDLLAFFEKTIDKIVDMAEKGELQVPYEELAEGVEYNNIGEVNDDKLDELATKKAHQLVADGKYKDFNEAYQVAAFEFAEKLDKKQGGNN
jgi:hypothetical protein